MAIENYYSDLTLRKITETADARGGAVLSDTDTTFQGLVTQASTKEIEAARRLEIQCDHNLYCAVTVDIAVKDKVVDGTKIYQVVGEPLNTVKRNHHYKVMLKRMITDGQR